VIDGDKAQRKGFKAVFPENNLIDCVLNLRKAIQNNKNLDEMQKNAILEVLTSQFDEIWKKNELDQIRLLKKQDLEYPRRYLKFFTSMT
jgi:hypothetical protein